jgi:ribosomal RNA-processing protein 8
MALFQVPGWTVPTEPVSVSKKRKRPKAPVEDDIASASVNVEKLMRSLDNVLANESKGTGGGKGKGKAKAVILGEDEDTPEPKKRKNAGEAKPKALSAPHAAAGQPPSEKKKKGKWDSEGKPHETTKSARQAAPDLVPPTPAPKGKKKKDAKREKSAPGDVPQVPSRSTAPQPAASQPGMTALQAKMKSSLDGARFRYVSISSICLSARQQCLGGSTRSSTSRIAHTHTT